MRAYNGLRRSGLITIGLILEKTEDELLATLVHLPRESFESEMLLFEITDTGEEASLSTQGQGSPSHAHKSYDELRKKLDEIGILPADAPWDSARGMN